MKVIKERFLKILTLILALSLSLGITACGEVDDTGEINVMVEVEESRYLEYVVILDNVADKSEGAASILKYLGSRGADSLEYDLVESTYGAYLNSIANLQPGAGQYIAIYTSVESDFSVPTEYYPTVPELTVDGKLLKPARVGLSSMKIEDGMTILFRLESFE